MTQPDSRVTVVYVVIIAVIVVVKVVVSGIIIADVAVIVIGSGTHCPQYYC